MNEQIGIDIDQDGKPDITLHLQGKWVSVGFAIGMALGLYLGYVL